jgi:excisionase family DNA binding protein
LDDQPLLTVPEAASILRVSRNSAYELIARGEIPAIRLGRRLRVSRAVIERLLDGHDARAAGYADARGRTGARPARGVTIGSG